jgi:hypothetical protein
LRVNGHHLTHKGLPEHAPWTVMNDDVVI